MSRNDQKFTLKRKNIALLLCIMIGVIFLLAACDTDTSGGGQSNTASSSSSSSNNNTGSQQRPDPCSLISVNDLQALIPGSRFPAPTSEGNLNQGGTDADCRFTDPQGITVILTIDPAGTTWKGMKVFHSQNKTTMPEAPGVGDDALYYYGVLEVLQRNYLFQVQVTYTSGASTTTIQAEEKQIAQAALQNW